MTLLYNEACPSHEPGRELLLRAGEAAAVPLEVEERLVAGDDEAERLGFAGSPTYRVAGADLLPGDEGPYRYDACRVYRRPDGRMAPLPALEELASALRDAARRAA